MTDDRHRAVDLAFGQRIEPALGRLGCGSQLAGFRSKGDSVLLAEQRRQAAIAPFETGATASTERRRRPKMR